MRLASDAALLLATDRLRWAVERPPRCGDGEWGARMGRALASLKEALRSHAALQESADGLFARAVDPFLLPITPVSRRVHELRHAHANLLDEISVLQRQLEGATQEPGSSSRSPRRTLGAIARGAERLLAAIHDHKAVEKDLPLDSRDPR